MAKILLVEDEEAIAEPILDFLKFESHQVEAVTDGQEAILRLSLSTFDLVILDWNLPKASGIDVMTAYRRSGGQTPILMLTAKNQVANKLEGLDAGADDYLTKPFDMRELGSRIRALLRRPAQTVSPILEVESLSLDTAAHKCTLDGVEIHLLAKEFAVLEFLARNKGSVFSADDLLKRVWRSDTESGPEAVRQCIARLRKKLNQTSSGEILKTIIGSGYKLGNR